MKSIKYIFSILVVAIITISCSKDDNDSEPNTGSDIFAIGLDNAVIPQNFIYKNNTKTLLSIEANENARISTAFVDGNDVYVTGSIRVTPATGSPYIQACYWKNNVKVNLPHTTSAETYANGTAITVINGDVYVVGEFYASFSEKSRIVLWKNGVSSFVTPYSTTTHYNSESICVYNNDVYVAGYGSNPTTDYNAKFWKNGIETTLSTNYSTCSSIIANQNGIHVLFEDQVIGGSGFNTAIKYWKDGVSTTISTLNTKRPELGKMAIKGTDVYITGGENAIGSFDYEACYWKNSVKTKLAGGLTLTGDIIKIAANGDVFITNELDDGPEELIYWKNNIKTTIGTNMDTFKAFDINKK